MPVSVLIAHLLGTYASSLAGLLQAVRPSLDVQRVELDELDARIANQPGALVISDRQSPAVTAFAGAQILYYPDQANLAVVIDGNGTRTIENPRLDELLAALDCIVWRIETAERILDS